MNIYKYKLDNDYIKVHDDHGLRTFNDRLFYLFEWFKPTKVQNVNFTAGFGHVVDNYNTENRLKVFLGAENNQ